MSDPRRVEFLPLANLVADPRNPKAHDESTIDQSIGRFGVLDPIVQDQRTGFIVSGHGRHKVLTAMQDRGESAPEGVKVADDGSWLVPVVTGWASRTDTEAAAALIALNRTTELGGWVDDALLDILDELSSVDDGLAGVGFSDDDREALEELSFGVGAALSGGADLEAPEEFREYSETIATEHECPSCGYQWSGSSKPKNG